MFFFHQTYRDIISQIMFSNPAAMVISGITITILSFNNEILKVWYLTDIVLYFVDLCRQSIKLYPYIPGSKSVPFGFLTVP